MADFLQLITSRLSLEEMPASSGALETEDFSWTLYSVEVQGVAVEIAATEKAEEETVMVLLQCPVEERDTLYETVSVPAVEALAPTAGED